MPTLDLDSWTYLRPAALSIVSNPFPRIQIFEVNWDARKDRPSARVDRARTPESMSTFPKIAADTSIQSATATLVKGTSGGWAVVPPQPAQ
jgi:hypothetical protein